MPSVKLQFVPAHYLHSSGNFHVYDPAAKLLISGDVGAAQEPPGAPMFVDDFAAHVPKMELFHRRWMPSNRAKNDWVMRIRKLDIRIPVIVINGFISEGGSPPDPTQSDALNVQCILAKPFTNEQLGNAVRRILDQAALAGGNG